jgi:hypothetical protein
VAASLLFMPAPIGAAQPEPMRLPGLTAEPWTLQTRIDPAVLEPRLDASTTFDVTFVIEQRGDVGDLRSLEILRWPEGAEPALEARDSTQPRADAGAATVQAVNVGDEVRLEDVALNEWLSLTRLVDTVQPIALDLSQVKYFAPNQLAFLDATAAGEPVMRQARLFFTIQSAPLNWLLQEGAYGENLIVGLDPVDEDARGHRTPEYVVRLTTEGARVSGPTTLRFNVLGQETVVPLRVDDHRGPIAATAHMNDVTQRLELSVRPRLTSLGLTVTTSTPFGLGLQPVAFAVQRYAEDGYPLAADQDIELRAVGNGMLFDREGRLPIGRGATSVMGRLRSTGLAGAASFYVTEGTVRSDPVEIRFVFPWLVLVIAAFGGALGAIVHRGFRRVEGPIWRDAATGMLVGVIAVAAAILGLSGFGVLTNTALTGAGAFVAAALAGYGGSRILDQLVNTAYGPPSPPTPAPPADS